MTSRSVKNRPKKKKSSLFLSILTKPIELPSKSEIPNAEIRKKSEVRNPKMPNFLHVQASDFEFRVSGFGFEDGATFATGSK